MSDMFGMGWSSGGSSAISYKELDSIIVAGINAPDNVKDGADYVCDGVTDEIQLQSAIDENSGLKLPVQIIGKLTLSSPVDISNNVLLKGNRLSSVIIPSLDFVGNHLIEDDTAGDLNTYIDGLFMTVLDMYLFTEAVEGMEPSEIIQFYQSLNIPRAIQLSGAKLSNCEIEGQIDIHDGETVIKNNKLTGLMDFVTYESGKALSVITMGNYLDVIDNRIQNESNGILFDINTGLTGDIFFEGNNFLAVSDPKYTDPESSAVFKNNRGISDTP